MKAIYFTQNPQKSLNLRLQNIPCFQRFQETLAFPFKNTCPVCSYNSADSAC